MMPFVVAGPDDKARRLTALALRHGGFEVKLVGDIEYACKVLRRHRIDGVVTIGAVLPSAVDIADLRTRTDVPIVVIAEDGDAFQRAMLLDAGADDVIGYPYDVDELIARVRASVRRFARAHDDEPPVETDDFAVFVADRRFVRADGTEAALSPTEWRIVEVLLRRPGHLVGQDEIIRSVWGEKALEKPGLLRVHLASIRRKTEPDPGRPRYFVTAPGLGIRFEPSTIVARGSAS